MLNLIGNLLLVVVAAIFMAAQPDLYRRGVLALVPAGQRDLAADTLDTSGSALKQWLLAQLVAMAMVGSLTAVGLWLVGVPTPLALGLISGLAEFVPIVGPILGAIPAVLLAISIDWTTALWAIGVVVVVQQLEANLIMPLIQQRLAALPPVITMFAILAFGLLFGPLGLLAGDAAGGALLRAGDETLYPRAARRAGEGARRGGQRRQRLSGEQLIASSRAARRIPRTGCMLTLQKPSNGSLMSESISSRKLFSAPSRKMM